MHSKSSPSYLSHSRGTPSFPVKLNLSPFSPPDLGMRVDSPALSGKGSSLPSHLRRRPVSHWNSRTSLVFHATFRKTPISPSTQGKFRCPGTFLSVTLRMKSQHKRELTPQLHRPGKAAGSKYNSTSGLTPKEQLQRQADFLASTETRTDSPVPTLQRPCDQSQKWRGTLWLPPQLEMTQSPKAQNPVESREAAIKSTVFLTFHRHPEKLPEVTVTSPGNPGFHAATRERPRDAPFKAS